MPQPVSTVRPKPLVLIILDGWGVNPSAKDNAIAAAHTPHWDQLLASSPQRTLSGSGTDVGLPDGQMGNSEVGHMHLGAGRKIDQDLSRISHAIEQGEFQKNPVLRAALSAARESGRTCHILGLLSPGGVHSHERHLHALIAMAAREKCPSVAIHAFLDGRDCPPQSARASLEALEQQCQSTHTPGIRIATLCGRYYAMDRDNRWDRTQRVYDCLTAGKAAAVAPSALVGLDLAYARGENDEFVQPTVITAAPATVIAADPARATTTTIQSGDVVIFMNFRADRARQLTQAFIDPQFSGFPRQTVVQLKQFVSLTEYAKNLPTDIAYPAQTHQNVLGEVLAKHDLTQLRIAETEKYAHVTFFLNGGREDPFPGEERVLIPSPQDVATYDLKPEMSAPEITEILVNAIKRQQFDVMICNYANPDMVGHTGNFPATVKAIECIDHCLGNIIAAIKAVHGELLITADHGNAECMFDPKTHQAHTAHTNLPVPLVYLGRAATFDSQPANLADIAPTMLHLLGIRIPTEMTGRNLLTLRN